MNVSKCIEGETFSVSVNETCKKCSSCPKDAHVIQKCTANQDTLCSCEKGSFLSTVTNECKQCTPCPHGWGVWRRCSRNRNSVCRKCPPDTYSGVLSDTLGCFMCKSCRTDQIMLQECSPIQDTICVDQSIEVKQFSTTINSDEKDVLQLNESNSLPIINVFEYTILAVIICSFVAYVVFRWRLKNVMKAPQSIINASGYLLPSSNSRNCVNYWPLSETAQRNERSLLPHQFADDPFAFSTIRQPNSWFNNTRLCNGTPKVLHFRSNRFPVVNSFANSSNRIVSESRTPELTANRVIRYTELSSTKKRALEASLNLQRNDTRDWKGLAKELGYSTTSIAGFAELGRENYGPTRHLLNDWSKSENATVSSLVMNLLKIGRVDSASIVDPTCLKVHPSLPGGLLV